MAFMGGAPPRITDEHGRRRQAWNASNGLISTLCFHHNAGALLVLGAARCYRRASLLGSGRLFAPAGCWGGTLQAFLRLSNACLPYRWADCDTTPQPLRRRLPTTPAPGRAFSHAGADTLHLHHYGARCRPSRYCLPHHHLLSPTHPPLDRHWDTGGRARELADARDLGTRSHHTSLIAGAAARSRRGLRQHTELGRGRPIPF